MAPLGNAVLNRIHEALQDGDSDALVAIRNDIHSLRPGPGRDMMLAHLIRAFYICGETERARSEAVYVDDNRNVRAATMIRKTQIILDRELRYSESALLKEAKHLIKLLGDLDFRTSVSIVQRLCNVSMDDFRANYQNHSDWYRQVATLVSQKPLTTEPINQSVNVKTGEDQKFDIPNTLNSICYAIEHHCSVVHHVPILTLYELQDVVLYKDRHGIAILQDRQFVSNMFTPSGIFAACYGDWSDVPILEVPDPTIFMLDRFSGANYCHWHFDALTRLLLLKNAFPEIRSNATVVIGKATPYTVGSLSAFGVAPERILETGDRARIRFSRLYVSSTSFADLRHPAQCGNPDILRELRNKLTSEMPSNVTRSKVFISRRDAGSRQLANEDDVQSALAPLGVQFVAPGELSYRDQVATFSNASLIIGPHGAGMTNLLFAPEGATIVELFPPRFGNPSYYTLSVGLGHDYICMDGEGKNYVSPSLGYLQMFARDDFTISLDILHDFVRQHLS